MLMSSMRFNLYSYNICVQQAYKPQYSSRGKTIKQSTVALLFVLVNFVTNLTQLSETNDATHALLRYRFQKFDALNKIFFLIKELRIVLFKRGLIQFRENYVFNGSNGDISLAFFLDSAFHKCCKFGVQRIHFGYVSLDRVFSFLVHLFGISYSLDALMGKMDIRLFCAKLLGTKGLNSMRSREWQKKACPT